MEDRKASGFGSCGVDTERFGWHDGSPGCDNGAEFPPLGQYGYGREHLGAPQTGLEGLACANIGKKLASELGFLKLFIRLVLLRSEQAPAALFSRQVTFYPQPFPGY